VLSLSSLIEFLLDMLRDPATQNEYARDPNAALAARGLSNVTAQDIHDVQPLLADHTGVSTSGGAHAAHATSAYAHSYGGSPYAAHHVVAHDPLPAIQHVTNAYEVDRSMVVRNVTQEYKQYATYKTYVSDHSIHAENGGTVIQDSFNTENAGVDLRGAHVDNSVIAGGDANDSGNAVTSTTTTGSNNDDHSTTVTDSHNSSADHDYTNVGNDSSTHSHDSSDSHDSTDSHDSGDVNDSYGAHAAHAAPVDDGADVTAHHA
jgi:hypothetical protein